MANKRRRSGNHQRTRANQAKAESSAEEEGIAGFLSSPGGLIAVALVAVVVVLLMIFMGGGLAKPTAALPTVVPSEHTDDPEAADLSPAEISVDSLSLCAGSPCPSAGAPDAPVTIVEVSDFTCGHCKTFNLETAPSIMRDYVDTGRANYVSHVFGFYPKSQAVSAAALCAHEQGMYFAYQELAFADDIAMLEEADLVPAILEAGSAVVPDTAAFADCVSEGRYMNDVSVSTDEAMSNGIQYTPTLLIGDDMIEGAVTTEAFLERIEQALQDQS